MSTAIPRNQSEWTLAEVAQITTGQLVSGIGTDWVRGVTTDSRGDVQGQLFVALEGERFDGHDYVEAAARSGASAVMIRRAVSVPDGVGVIRVDRTLESLGALGRAHRRRWGGTVVGIGGSAGKTSTRATICSLLDACWPGEVHWTTGNLNNQIGVPHVLFGLQAHHRVAVIEVGTNFRGEVARIASVVEPDVAVLTLVGLEHTEGIGTLDDVELEEGDLLRAVGRAGTAVANGDDARARRQLADAEAHRRIVYGSGAGDDYRLTDRRGTGAHGCRLTIERTGPTGRGTLELTSPLLGYPGALSVLAAVAVADRLTGRLLTGEAVEAALGRGSAREPGRLSPIDLADGSLLLDDSYNSNPASARASLEVAREIAGERGARLVLVLGEMRELGAISVDEHEALGRVVDDSGAVRLVAVAGDAESMVGQCQKVAATFAENSDRALEQTLESVQPGDVILVKGSRGVRTERVVEGLLERRGAA